MHIDKYAVFISFLFSDCEVLESIVLSKSDQNYISLYSAFFSLCDAVSMLQERQGKRIGMLSE